VSFIFRLHDEANIKQTSSKRQETSSKREAIRTHVVHVYFECICLMFALLDVC